MPTLFGRSHSRAELLRRIGRLEQLGGVRLVTLEDGTARGVRVLEFRTGPLAFDVLVDRAFDIGRCELASVPVAWQAAPGVVGPWYTEHEDWSWFRSWGGGLMVTCGLDHTLGPGEDSAEMFGQPHIRSTQRFPLHGRVGGLPARLVGHGESWLGDDRCVLWAEGEVLQAAVYGEQLLLRRRIEADLGTTVIRVRDTVENVGHTPVSHMLLYHCNLGYPLLDDGSELLLAARSATTSYGVPVAGYRSMGAPVAGAAEACFEHDLIAEPGGTVPAGLVNRRLGVGMSVVSRIEQLPFLTVWRMLGEGDYGLALEPSTNRDAGRWDARERGELITLEPGEVRRYELELGGLVGADAIETFGRRVSALGGAPV